MKTFITISLCLFSITAFSKTTIYSFYGTSRENDVNYFYPSSFSQNSNFCYTGLSGEVCLEAQAGSAIVKREYAEGAHDYFEIVSCVSELNQVTVHSELFNDYTLDSVIQKNLISLCE